MLADPWTALGDRTRRAIFVRVADGPASVATIARELPISGPTVSQHLKVLKDAGLVSVEPHGRQRIYTLRAEGTQQLRAELDRFWPSTTCSPWTSPGRCWSPAQTRVELEHRHPERHGEGWQRARSALENDNGWPLYLRRFDDLVRGA